MHLFKRKAPRSEAPPEVTRKTRRRSPPATLEVKLLALEALASGLARKDVADIIGVAPVTLGNWQKLYDEGGLRGLYGRPSSPTMRRRCKVLQDRILAYRRAHPEHGVRRVRDELRRQEGLQVSAETVRSVVKEAGLGNPPPTPARASPAVRRFERPLPNALWQIDIFTFLLKRMYRVYLIGIIDDHSRYLVGWGLFRQQTAEAVLEVVKGAIGQWGAPREILSDNGRQFVSWRGKSRFQRMLKQQGIGHVRSAPHHPMTLGKIERFWQTIWREFLSEAVFASFADACQRLDHWVQYYNHQRPHQGIEGACPADRFYGVAQDVEEAIRQGCKDNSLKLALGQDPQPPLYLLGQLGGTDVRVVRKGEDLEVKVGETVHGGREADSVEGSFGRGSLERDRAGTTTGDSDSGTVSAFRDQSSDLVPPAGSRRASGEGGPGTASSGSQEEASERAEAGVASTEPGPATQGAGPMAPEIRSDEDASGTGAAPGSREAPAGGAGKKSETELDLNGYVGRYTDSHDDEGGQSP